MKFVNYLKYLRRIGIYFNDDEIVFCSNSRCLFKGLSEVYTIPYHRGYISAAHGNACINKGPTKVIFPLRHNTIVDYEAFRFLIQYIKHNYLPWYFRFIKCELHTCIPTFLTELERNAVLCGIGYRSSKYRNVLVFEHIALLKGLKVHSGIILSLTKTVITISIIKDLKIITTDKNFRGYESLIDDIKSLFKERYRILIGEETFKKIINEGSQKKDFNVIGPHVITKRPIEKLFSSSQFKPLFIKWVNETMGFAVNFINENCESTEIPLYISDEFDNNVLLNEWIQQKVSNKISIVKSSHQIMAMGSLR